MPRWTGPTSSRIPGSRRLTDRAEHGDVINTIVAEWTTSRSAAQVEAACVAHDVPVATAYTAVDMFADAQFAARGDLVPIDDPVIGPVRQQAPYPRFVGEPVPVPSGAPRLGADTDAVLGELGLDADRIASLRDDGVIG